MTAEPSIALVGMLMTYPLQAWRGGAWLDPSWEYVDNA
jgi:hypothetical protein